MFNYDAFQKKAQVKQEIESMQSNFLKDQQKRQQKNQKLTEEYKRRVENFVINMLENPVVFNQYKGPKDYKTRDQDPQQFIGDAQFYVQGFKHQKDRILESEKKNQDLDYFPNLLVGHYQYRDRHVDKEIQPDMRFTAKTSLERIEQFIKDHMQTQVENEDYRKQKGKKAESIFESMPQNLSPNEKRAFFAREIAQNLLPSLHNQTHFNAAEILYNDLPISISKHQLNNQNQAGQQSENTNNNDALSDNQDEKQEVKDNKTGGLPKLKSMGNLTSQDHSSTKQSSSHVQGQQMEAFNPIETSQQVLENCQVIKRKNPQVKQIHPGQGHLISTLDKSISEIYKSILNKDINKSILTNQ